MNDEVGDKDDMQKVVEISLNKKIAGELFTEEQIKSMKTLVMEAFEEMYESRQTFVMSFKMRIESEIENKYKTNIIRKHEKKSYYRSAFNQPYYLLYSYFYIISIYFF